MDKPNLDHCLPFHCIEEDGSFYHIQYWLDCDHPCIVYWQVDDEWQSYNYQKISDTFLWITNGTWRLDWLRREPLTNWLACRQFVSG